MKVTRSRLLAMAPEEFIFFHHEEHEDHEVWWTSIQEDPFVCLRDEALLKAKEAHAKPDH